MTFQAAAIPIVQPEDVRLFTVDEYHRIAELGIFGNEGIELLNGIVYNKYRGIIRQFTIDEYHQMADAGLFDNQRVELLNGIVRLMAAMNTPHFGMTTLLSNRISYEFFGKYTCLSQGPVKIVNVNEPEPDIMIAKYRKDAYMGKSVEPEDVYLLIEVSDSTLRRDRTEKMLTYAGAGIVEYWIINLKDYQIEVFKQPEKRDYRFRDIVRDGELTCERIGFTVDVEELFSHLEKKFSDSKKLGGIIPVPI